MTTERYNWIDWAKAIAIFLMVIGHQYYPTGGINLLSKNVIYAFHMPLFFFLSGFLVKKNNTNYKQTTVHDIKSLIIPYVFFNLASYLLMIPLFGVFRKQAFIDSLLAGNNPLGGATWFLLCLFFVKQFFYFLQKFPVKYQMALPFFVIGHYCNKYDILTTNNKQQTTNNKQQTTNNKQTS